MNHVSISNCPPPPLCPQQNLNNIIKPTFSNVSFNTTTLNKYKERLNNYSQFRRMQPTKLSQSVSSKTKLKLGEVATEVRHGFYLIDAINEKISNLTKDACSINENEWMNQVSEISTKMSVLSNICSKYQDQDTHINIKHLVEKRKRKRECIRERKAEIELSKNHEDNRRKIKHRRIDVILEGKSEKILEGHRIVERMQRAEQILLDVKCRKNEAEKYINLLDSLSQLHRIGNKDSQYNATIFDREVNEIRQMWLDASQMYEAEEKNLRAILNCNDHYDSWQKCLFGDSTTNFPYRKEDNSLNKLLCIRHVWDKYIVSNNNSFRSSVPICWVLPNTNPPENWRKYLKTEIN